MSQNDNPLGKLLELEETLSFVPTQAQIKTKAKLLAMLAENPMYDLEFMSLDVAIEFTREKKLRSWWKIDGFEPWFKNKTEFRSEVEELIMLSLSRLRTILNSENEKMAQAQISAAKLLFDAADKIPRNKDKGRYADDDIARMNSEQLEEFLKKAGYQKIQAPPEPKFIAISEGDEFKGEGYGEE